MNAANLDAILASATTTKSGKDKSKALEVVVTEAKVVKQVDTWIASAKQVDLHKAKMVSSQDDILEYARKHHLEHVSLANAIPATVKLVIPTGSLSIDIAKNQYGKIDRATSEEGLKKHFGEHFDKCFNKVLSIKLTDAALSDPNILTALIKAVGADNFKKYFEVEQLLKPTPALHEGRFLNEEIQTAYEGAAAEKLIAPFAPSFKG